MAETVEKKIFGVAPWGSGQAQNWSNTYNLNVSYYINGSNYNRSRLFVFSDSNSDLYATGYIGGSTPSCSNIGSSHIILVSSDLNAYKTEWDGFIDTEFPESSDITISRDIVWPVKKDGIYYYIDFRNPIFQPYNWVNSNCSSVETLNKYVFPYVHYEVEESIGGGSTGGEINLNSDDIVHAIFMIPATMIVLSAFLVIYRMFINRRVRG